MDTVRYPLPNGITSDTMAASATIGVVMKIKSELPETDEPLTYSIPFAGSLVGIGKNASYAAARRGEIPTIRFGKKLRVPKAKFLRMLSGDLPEDANRLGNERAGEPEGDTVAQGRPKGIIPANRRG